MVDIFYFIIFKIFNNYFSKYRDGVGNSRQAGNPGQIDKKKIKKKIINKKKKN